MNSTKTNMAAPGVHESSIGDRLTPEQCEKSTREDPVPILPTRRKADQDVKHKEPAIEQQTKESEETNTGSETEDLVMSVESVSEPSNMETDMCTDDAALDTESEVLCIEELPSQNAPSVAALISQNLENAMFADRVTPSVLDTGQRGLPLIPELLQQRVMKNKENEVSKVKSELPKDNLPIKSPYKGVMVPCGKLKEYLDSLLTFNRKCMLRKGREVHKIYVDMLKGECFLDDQFSYTEFGRMVLTNGSIRAGRAKNAKQIVVARETLYCSGTATCKRACGGYGICLQGCDKTKMRGHRCAYRIKLTQRLGYVNFWFVEELGSHDQLGGGKDSDFKTNSIKQGGNTPQLKGASALDLSPKTNKSSPDHLAKHSPTSSILNGGHESVSNSPSESSNDATPNYHYVLGLMPSSSPSRESPSRSSPSRSSEALPSLANSSLFSQQQDNSAIDVKSIVSSVATSSNTVLVSVPSSQVVSTTMPNLPVSVVSFMPELLGLGVSPLQPGFNPLLVKQEPQEESQGQGHLMIPMVMPTAPIQYSPSHLAKSHSPSPSRNIRERSPLTRDQTKSIQKGSEIEDKPNNDGSQKMQAKQNTLGQVHNRIMERARSRKSAQTVRVPQRSSPNQDQTPNTSTILDKPVNHNPAAQEAAAAINLSIPKSVGSDGVKMSDENLLASIPSFERFQTLNRILQSDAFQAAKSQLEMKKLQLEKGDQSQEMALNLTMKPTGSSHESSKITVKEEEIENQTSYFRLMQEWKENQSTAGACYQNGHVEEDVEETDSEELTDNEKELINRVRQLESHVKQLQNIVIKRESDASANRRKKAQRDFDFTRYNTRHVALKIMYLGCDYHGFAVQEDTDRTIEQALFEALKKTRLIESRETSNYHRCGRTDKGVSAFGQVISIDLRSNLISGVGVKVREGGTAQERPGDKTVEIRYCQILNKVLPPEIRVLAWAPVHPEFSARFSCRQRTYKYIFPKANLDIPAMNEAAQKLIGEKDYRNLCKMDVANGVTNFTRKMISADISMLSDEDSGYSMCELTIVGSSFLWHQIRCIVAVLILIGQGKEKVEIIDKLLDVKENPKKPQYTMAHEVPLCLYDSEFGDNFEWIYEADWHEDNIKHLQQLWAEHSIKATMLKRMLEDLDKAKVETECDIAPWSDLSPPVFNQVEWLTPGNKPRTYKPLMERPTCESLEERMESLAKRRKLNPAAAASDSIALPVSEKE